MEIFNIKLKFSLLTLVKLPLIKELISTNDYAHPHSCTSQLAGHRGFVLQSLLQQGDAVRQGKRISCPEEQAQTPSCEPQHEDAVQEQRHGMLNTESWWLPVWALTAPIQAAAWKRQRRRTEQMSVPQRTAVAPRTCGSPCSM